MPTTNPYFTNPLLHQTYTRKIMKPDGSVSGRAMLRFTIAVFLRKAAIWVFGIGGICGILSVLAPDSYQSTLLPVLSRFFCLRLWYQESANGEKAKTEYLVELLCQRFNPEQEQI